VRTGANRFEPEALLRVFNTHLEEIFDSKPPEIPSDLLHDVHVEIYEWLPGSKSQEPRGRTPNKNRYVTSLRKTELWACKIGLEQACM
jgi:hypothetical protein